jgi:pimeloyl-ACP methyl ester carboxylesterase
MLLPLLQQLHLIRLENYGSFDGRSEHSRSIKMLVLELIVLLLHGWPQTMYEWHKIMPALAKNYTVIVPDLRGLGDSSKPATGYDGNTTAEDIYQLVNQLGFNKIYLVGHDVGAQTAYSYAAIHPNNVSKLVILDVPLGASSPISLPGLEDCC